MNVNDMLVRSIRDHRRQSVGPSPALTMAAEEIGPLVIAVMRQLGRLDPDKGQTALFRWDKGKLRLEVYND